MKKQGYIIYEGASMIDGEPIVAIVTMQSSNIKTGDMPSMWIMHKDVRPTEASKLGLDKSVCGDCKLRHHLNGACYVTLHQAPLSVWKAYKRGNYIKIDSFEKFNDVTMRFGAYGDPFAIPIDILTDIKSRIKNNTSYTHQWKVAPDELKAISMASADSIDEAKEAQSQGWRTFRVTHDESILMDNEIICPNYTHDVQCIDCKLCSGAGNQKSIVIPVHGIKSKKFIE